MNSFIVVRGGLPNRLRHAGPLVKRVNNAGSVSPAVRSDEIDEPALPRLYVKNAIGAILVWKEAALRISTGRRESF